MIASRRTLSSWKTNCCIVVSNTCRLTWNKLGLRRFAYALARVRNQGIMTIDADFKAVDVAVLLPQPREMS